MYILIKLCFFLNSCSLKVSCKVEAHMSAAIEGRRC